MLASTQTVDTLVSSTSSSHSSGSKSSLFNSTGGSYGVSGTSSETVLGGRPASVAQLRVTSNPADYRLIGVAPDTYVLHAIAAARVYHSTQLSGNRTVASSFGRSSGSKEKSGGSQWVYSHLKGTLVFGRDKYSPGFEAGTIDEIVASSQKEGGEPNGEWWFQLIDDEAGKVLWKFKLPLGPGSKFTYELDRPFFHVFRGSSRKYGLLFEDDKESTLFSEEVNSRITAAMGAACTQPSKSLLQGLNRKPSRKTKSLNSYPGSAGIPRTIISTPAPNSFKHIAHIGFNQSNGTVEASKDLDPAFRDILTELQVQTGSSMTENVVLEHLEFVQGYWKDANTIQRSSSSRPVAAN